MTHLNVWTTASFNFSPHLVYEDVRVFGESLGHHQFLQQHAGGHVDEPGVLGGDLLQAHLKRSQVVGQSSQHYTPGMWRFFGLASVHRHDACTPDTTL